MSSGKTPANFGWSVIEGMNDAEKTVAFGANPLKTHRLYGVDAKDLLRQIEDFEARLEAVNGPEVAAEDPAGEGEATDDEAADEESVNG